MNSGKEQPLKIADVAKRLEISVATAYNLANAGKLPHYRIGNGRGTIRVTEEQLNEFLGIVEKRNAPQALPPKVRPYKSRHFD